jgi:hypothetical protein
MGSRFRVSMLLDCVLVLYFIQPVAPLHQQRSLTQLFMTAWADSMGHCLVYFSLMSMRLYVCTGYWHNYFLQLW